MVEQIFLKTVNMSITAGYCVLVVLLLRLFLRKIPKIYSYSLWFVVFFRLACPVSIQSALSLVKIRTQPIPQDIGMQRIPQIASGYAPIDRAVNNALRQTLPAPQAAASVNPMQIAIAVASILWIAGMLLLAVYGIGSYLCLRARLRGAALIEKGAYEIYVKENLQTPFVLGIIKPRIYLPPSLDKEERLFVLEHEKAHIRRKDYLVRQAAYVISCAHWFNPLAWLSFSLMCRDMEMSCDESVMKRLGAEKRKAYSAALLSLASGKRIRLGSPLAFGESSVESRSVKGRIVNVLSYQKPAFWVSILAVLVIAAVIAGLSLNPRTDTDALKDGTASIALENVKMASGVMVFSSGSEVTVELWLTEGRFYDGTMDEFLPRIDAYSENYEGRYELRTVDGQGGILFQTDLKELWQEANDIFNFPREFTLQWADYNADGCPDFTIGVPQSSVNMGFLLITVRENGALERINREELCLNSFENFSVVFEHDAKAGKMPITGTRYNNVTGEVENIVYQYDEQTGLYEEAGADNWSDALHYTGYLDESPYTIWRDGYANLDYDFDDLTDRIYREIALFAKREGAYQRVKLPKSSREHYDWGDSEHEAGHYMTESYDAEQNVMTIAFADMDYQMQFTPKEEVAPPRTV